MKMILTIFGLMISLNAQALNYDGCYQLYLPNTMYPVFCLGGTTLEGVNGAGVQLAIFHTNTSTVEACVKSSKLSFTDTDLVFERNGVKEMILSNIKRNKGGRLEGDATFGQTTLKFMQFSKEQADRLQDIAYTSPLCR